MLLSYQGLAYSYVVVGGTIAGANGAGAAASCVGPTNNSTVNDNWYVCLGKQVGRSVGWFRLSHTHMNNYGKSVLSTPPKRMRIRQHGRR